MLSENDSRYLGQGSMQLLLQLLGCKCFCEKLIEQVTYEPAKIAIEHLRTAADEITKAYDIFTDGVDAEQIKRLMRFNACHRIALVSEADPVLKKIPMIMDWEQIRIIVDILNREVCSICGKNKDEVRKCPLRETVYSMGGEPDMQQAKFNEWCEISRGIL